MEDQIRILTNKLGSLVGAGEITYKRTDKPFPWWGDDKQQDDFIEDILKLIKEREENYQKVIDRAQELEHFIMSNSMKGEGYNSKFQEKACILVGLLTSIPAIREGGE